MSRFSRTWRRTSHIKVNVTPGELQAFHRLSRYKRERLAAVLRQLAWREIRDYDVDVSDVCPDGMLDVDDAEDEFANEPPPADGADDAEALEDDE